MNVAHLLHAPLTLSEYWHELRTLGEDDIVTLLHMERDQDRRAAIMAELDRRNPPVWISSWMWSAIRKTVQAA